MFPISSRETNVQLKMKSKLFNSETSSDVSFVVGDQKTKFYAHRAILYMYSDVFGQMFYGGLKEKDYEIEVPDLDPIGFENMLKFMYGYDLVKGDGKGEMKPRDLWVTYQAADKYLVEELKGELIFSSLNRLDKFNVCLLYDQFLRMPFDDIGGLVCKESTLNIFRKLIQAYSKDAFESESFIEIKEDTLVNLLKLEFLNLPEFDVLKACLRWMDAEIERRGLVATPENKQKVFLPIKPFVRFTDLGDKQLSELSEVKEIFTLNESASLFLRLTEECDRVSIKCKTERRKGRKVYTVRNESYSFLSDDDDVDENGSLKFSYFTVNFRTEQKICITSIQTRLFYRHETELKIFKYKPSIMEFVPLAFLEFEHSAADGNLCLEPKRALEIDPNVDYKFIFNIAEREFWSLSKESSFSNEGFHFKLSDFGVGHCIIGFMFCQISNYETAKST